MRKKHRAIPLLLTLILMLTMAPAVYASSLAEPQEPHILNGSIAPDHLPLSTLAELLDWHATPEVWGGSSKLTEDIPIDRPITLSETEKGKDIGAIEHLIRVTAGGKLTLDNSNLVVQGPQTVIVVEPGGQLLLQKGAIYTAPGYAIVVERGGKFVKSGTFLIDRGQILDKNQLPPDSNLTPPPNKPEEIPPPTPALPALLNTRGIDYSLSCLQGEPPASSDYPSKEWVFYETADKVPVQKELPVQWELDVVDFHTAGTYVVKGIFTEETLSANGLSNPNNLSATLQLTVLKPSPLDTLTGNVLSVGSTGNCHIRLALPQLPEDVTALYIYQSSDGESWQKVVQKIYINGNIPSTYDNFLSYAQITPTKTYIQYRYQTDYRPIWLRVEVVGSAVAGTSNEIKLDMPASAKPGDSIHTGETGDDGSFGGNRGGGGQSEGDRQLPNVPEKPYEDKTLPTDYSYPAYSTPEQIPSETSPQKVFTVGNIPMGESGDEAAKQSEAAVSKPSTSIPYDSGKQEVTESSSKQETEAIGAEVEILSTDVQSSLPSSQSRGVLPTAVATVFAAGGLLLLRKIYKIRKRKS